MITWKPAPWHQVLTRLSRSRRLTQAEQDACAEALDRTSELASIVEESQDFVESLVSASGAPDGESLLKRIGELRALAAERDALKAQIADIKTRATGWSQRAITAEGRVKELESTPAREPELVHPAVMAVVEAARRWVIAPAYSDEDGDAETAIHRTVGELPPDLPRVVTCGECVHWTRDRCGVYSPQRETFADDFCHLGKRRGS